MATSPVMESHTMPQGQIMENILVKKRNIFYTGNFFFNNYNVSLQKKKFFLSTNNSPPPDHADHKICMEILPLHK